jgi:hypothetical protein
MNRKPKSHILFTGLIRNEKLFLEKLVKAVELRDEGLVSSIIFSTWLNELTKYETVQRFLDKNEIIIIESSEPNLKLPGYVLHQMKSLHLGLSLISEKDYVFKMRPDLGSFNTDSVRNILNHNYSREVKTRANWPKVLREKIVIEGGFMMHPFYMNDIQFYGLCIDLKKMVNFDLAYEILYNDLSTEQYFYISPFLSHFPILEKFFMVNQGLFHGDSKNAQIYLNYFLHSNFHLKVLATYMLILDSYFHINGTNDIDYHANTTVEDIFSGNVPDVFTYPSLPFSPVFKGNKWICYLIAYRGSDERTNRLNKYLKMAEDIDFQKIISVNLYENNVVLDVKKTLKNTFSNNRSKIPVKINENTYRVQGGLIRASLMDTKNPLVLHLETQLNLTKRKYDEACFELEKIKNAK